MRRNLGPLSLLTAGLILLNSVPVLSQQQVAALRRGDATNNEARKTGPATPEEYRAEISRLRSRKTALQTYIATVDPASGDFLVTSRSVREIDLRLKELNETLQILTAEAARKLTLAQNAYLGKYRAEVKLKIDPAYAGDVKLTVIDRLGSEVFSRTLTSLMRGVNDYTTIVDLTDGQNIVVASSPDDKELSNSLVLLGGAAQPDPQPAARVAAPPVAASMIRAGAGAAPAMFANTVTGLVNQQCASLFINLDADHSLVSPLLIRVEHNNVLVHSSQIDLKDGQVKYRTRVPLKITGNVVESTITVQDSAGTDVGASLDLDAVKGSGCGGRLVGLLVGGAVISQQAENFTQADPFMGFTAGYSHFNPGGPELHWRVQGIFQVQPKKEEAPKSADASATPTPAATPTPDASPTPVPLISSDFRPFIASRKTFDIDMRFWVDFPFPSMFGGGKNEDVRIGPYALVGASTYTDKNELRGDQDVKVEKDETGEADGENGGQSELDTERSRVDNDLDSYWELGAIGNFYRGGGTLNRELFMQASVGVGSYEGLAGLDPGGANTRNRLIGRLRIFPTFLDVTPDGGANASPMFGVEINAGRGPDQIKFFTGIASAIKLFR